MKHLEKCQIRKAVGEVVRFRPDGMLFWVLPFKDEKWYIGIRRFGKDCNEVVWDYIEPTTEVEVVKLASKYYDGHYGLKNNRNYDTREFRQGKGVARAACQSDKRD